MKVYRFEGLRLQGRVTSQALRVSVEPAIITLKGGDAIPVIPNAREQYIKEVVN